MSNPLRVGFVCEGPTDFIVLEACLRSILGSKGFVPIRLQPEVSAAFEVHGGGWGGVYKWCKQIAKSGGGHASGNNLLTGFDVLVIHLDADVAGADYASASIDPETTDLALPCQQACPPVIATTDLLRNVLLSWCGETLEVDPLAICTPAQCTETWVLSALFPNDPLLRANPECAGNPEGRLQQQPKSKRIKKSQRDYSLKATEITKGWPNVAVLTESQRWANRIQDLVPP
jgi:hypothetical protein